MPTIRPKLLLLVTSSAWGGAERYVTCLASAATAEFDVTVAAGPSKSRELFSRLPPGVSYFEFKDLLRPISPISDLKAVLRLREFIDEQGFDLIHLNSSKAGLIGTLAARFSRSKPPVIYTAHGWGFSEKRSRLFKLAVLWSEKIAAPLRAATIVLTSAEREVAIKNGLASVQKTHLIPLGIDKEEISFLNRDDARQEISRICGLSHEGQIVGAIANAYPAKDLPTLLTAFNLLASKIPAVSLVICGDGPEMPRIHIIRDSLSNGKRIYLPGAVRDASRLLKGFDVFTLSSTKEGLPWVILEASLAETPIVATSVGAIPELIENRVNGLLVPPSDPVALSTAIYETLTNAELHKKLKSGVTRVAERRSGSGMVEKTLALYRSISRHS